MFLLYFLLRWAKETSFKNPNF